MCICTHLLCTFRRRIEYVPHLRLHTRTRTVFALHAFDKTNMLYTCKYAYTRADACCFIGAPFRLVATGDGSLDRRRALERRSRCTKAPTPSPGTLAPKPWQMPGAQRAHQLILVSGEPGIAMGHEGHVFMTCLGTKALSQVLGVFPDSFTAPT